MDHEVVVRQKMTERYLLDELDPRVRDEFEEHFFDCPKCAFDVRAGAAFVDQSKAVLAETRETETVPPATAVPARPRRGWMAWLRPAFAAPALAILLAMVSYQNLVTIPTLTKAVSNPQVLAWVPVNIGSYGADGPTIRISPGQGFLLFVRIPPQNGYSQRTADLYNPAGKLEWAVPIPAASSQGQWPVAVPAADRQAGTYKLIVRGTNATGTSEELGQGLFELQIQK
jgi:anti-sigma factor RsiW